MDHARWILPLACVLAASCVDLHGTGPQVDAAIDAADAADAADAPGSDAPRDDLPAAGRAACLGATASAPGAIDASRSRWQRFASWPNGAQARGAVTDAAGRSLVFGYVDVSAGRSDAFVMRLLANGALDPTWGDEGVTRVDGSAFGGAGLFHGGFDGARRLVLAGWTNDGASSRYYGLVVRFLEDGQIDRSFGRDGVVRVTPSGAGFGPYDSLVDDSGVLLVGAEEGNSLGRYAYAIRLDGDGAPDPAFGVDGVATVPGVSMVRSVVRDGDGYLGAALAGNPFGVALVRLRRDGSLDPRFGVAGVAAHPRGRGVIPVSLLRQPGGAIVVYGAYSPVADPAEGSPTLLRFTPDGRPDLSFGAGGLVASREGRTSWFNGFRTSAAVQCDGAVLALTLFGQRFPMLQRFRSDGALDATFGQEGRVLLLPGDLPDAQGYAVLPRDSDGSTVVISVAARGVVGHHVVGL